MKSDKQEIEELVMNDYRLFFPEEIDLIPQLIKETFLKCKKFMIVMDTNIESLYGKQMKNLFNQISSEVETYEFIILPGEQSKTMDNIMILLNELFKYRFSRTDVLIGFGGGLITDFAGFAASIFKRGIQYVSIPTTVLAMSDAAIGSKTGVNNKYGKNMIGSFYDPSLIVVCDKFLNSLDDRNISNGIAEIIKIAAMLDTNFFEILEQNDVQSLRRNPSCLRKVIRRSMELKISIVCQDKFESDKRMILNYGHTVGHGIEFASKESLLHGECVSLGIILANELALLKNMTSIQFCERIKNLLIQYNLPVQVPHNIKQDQILFYMGNDKKMSNKLAFQFVFVKDVGDVIYKTQQITSKEVLNILSSSIKIGSTNFDLLKDEIIVKLAGSKSITNRALVFAALLDKEIELSNILFAEDTEVMMDSLQKLEACSIKKIDSSRIVVKGNGGKFNFVNEREIYVNNSGTSARFLCSLLLLLNPNQSVIINCCDRMKERPIKDLIDALSDFLNFTYLEKQYYLPFRVTKKYEFKGGDIHINSMISSQFVTGILMASPYASNPTRVILSQSESITSETFIQMTYDMMKQFGGQIERQKQNIFKIENKPYQFQDQVYCIEPDAATASYDMAWAIFNQKKVTIFGFNKNSLQGDLKFTEKLISLGYCIEYSESGVVVRGDISRIQQSITSFDFNDCTDTFITFSVLLAAINNSSDQSYRITNIANQRVKECDRIHAVCKNLSKFGIKTKEYEDGLEIYPNRNTLLMNQQQKQQILIECYKDHRIGMAFSQLATFIANHNKHSFEVILDESSCVNKTFPSFYCHLKHTYAVDCQKVSLCKNHESISAHNLESNVLFIIGMRCCGKTTLSQKMSKHFNMNYLCLDDEVYKNFYSSKYQNLKEGIDSEGWEIFRSNELKLLKLIVADLSKYKNTIISCGGGIVTIPDAQDILKKQKYVIWLRRDLSDIEKDFSKRTNVPGYVNTMKDDYEIRRAKYEIVSKQTFNFPGYLFFSHFIGEKEYWGRIEKSLKNYLKKIFDSQHRKQGQDEYLYAEETHFVCMQFSDIKSLNFMDLTYIQKNYTALEIRGDVFFENNLESGAFNSPHNLIQLEEFCQIISRVKLVCNKISLIFTLRTKEEGGALFKQKNNYMKIIKYIQKQNIFDYIDIEVGLINKDNETIFEEISKNNALIISKHFLDLKNQQENIQQTLDKMEDIIRQQDILKLVLSPQSSKQELEMIRRDLISISPKSIVIQLGQFGKLSRIENNYLTPVYDSKFGPPTGQGQLQKNEIAILRKELNLSSTEKKFYIFGTDIINSPSPLIHNTCFELLNLTNYRYQIVQISEISEIEPYLRQKCFGGATITMPFKQDVNRYVNQVIGDAKNIGIDLPVINTIISLNSTIYGFNTDWYGIFKPLTKSLSHNQHYLMSKQKYALVIGAGATTMTMIYCLKVLGFQTIIYNRYITIKNKAFQFYIYSHSLITESKIEKFIGWNGVIQGFSDMNNLVKYLKDNKEIEISVIASTIPGKIDMKLSEEIFTYKPTIFDASYIPKETPLIQQAKQAGCSTFIYGIDMLLYQGYLQNQIFTGKKVSRKIIKNTLHNYYNKLHSHQ